MIVFNDIKSSELEALLNYMYIGEVNVLQTELAGLIKAAECLKIKGLAVPDDPVLTSSGERHKKLRQNSENSNCGKRNSSHISNSSTNSPQSKRIRKSDNNDSRLENSDNVLDISNESSPRRTRSSNNENKRNSASDNKNKESHSTSNSSSQEVSII